MSFVGDDSTYEIQQQDLRRIMATSFDEWWEANDMDANPFADRTESEETWYEARGDLLKEQQRNGETNE